METSTNRLNARHNDNMRPSIEDCPFPANFEEVFLQEFHRRRDERCFAKMKRWFTGQWRSSDFRWGTFLGGAATATAIIALVLSLGGFSSDSNQPIAKRVPDENKEDQTRASATKADAEAKSGIESETNS